MNLADLIRLYREVVVTTARLPRRIRVTTHAIPGTAVDVPTRDGREVWLHPEDWARLLQHLTPREMAENLSTIPAPRIIGLPVVTGDPPPRYDPFRC